MPGEINVTSIEHLRFLASCIILWFLDVSCFLLYPDDSIWFPMYIDVSCILMLFDAFCLIHLSFWYSMIQQGVDGHSNSWIFLVSKNVKTCKNMSKPFCVKELGLSHEIETYCMAWNFAQGSCAKFQAMQYVSISWAGSSTSCSTFFHYLPYEVDVLHFSSLILSEDVRRCRKLMEVECFDWFLLCHPGKWQLFCRLSASFSKAPWQPLPSWATRWRPSVCLLRWFHVTSLDDAWWCIAVQLFI